MANWKGIIRDGFPLLSTAGEPLIFDSDLSEEPPPECCDCEDCANCDPYNDDPDPENPEPLDVAVSGAATGTGFLYRSTGAGQWTYATDESNVALTDGCAEDWVAMSIQIQCPAGGGAPEATANIIRGVDDGCNIETGSVVATSWTCDPFTAVFEFETIEEPDPNATGCPCGVGQIVTVTVTEP